MRATGTVGSTRGGARPEVKATLKLESVAVDPSSPLITAAKKQTNDETENNGAERD